MSSSYPAQADFSLLDEQIQRYHVGKRTRSAAFIAWFLEAAFRLDPADIDDFICDGGGDKGIDAIVVDEGSDEIIIIQSKYRQSRTKLQGEPDLQQFKGASAYFDSPESVDRLLMANINGELRKLLLRLEIREKVEEERFSIKLLYITNTSLNRNAKDFIAALKDSGLAIEVWDHTKVVPVANLTRSPGLVPGKIKLETHGQVLFQTLTADTSMAIALVPAQSLVKLPGIRDFTIFEQNVRLSAGRTRVNRELAETVRDRSEHELFPAYHNGLTLLTNGMSADQDHLHLDGVAVANGCQSLLTLFRDKSWITPGLHVVVKVVDLGDDPTLTENITYRTNNQNPINMRDQRSNDRIQRHIQADVLNLYAGKLFYAVKRGEEAPAGCTVLENQVAAQLVTAAVLDEPWAAIRKVRLFDQDYHRVFSRRVDAHQVFLLHVLHEVADSAKTKITPELQSSFSSVRFTLVYLLKRALSLSETGALFLAEPERWLPANETSVRAKLGHLVDDIADSIKFHIESEREDEKVEAPYDPKVAFKSRYGVTKLERDVLRDLKRAERRDPDFLFNIEAGQ